MNRTGTTFRADEFSQRGQEIYDRDIRPNIRPEDIDQFVAIDIASGNYEIDPNDFTATERLLSKYPNAQIWLARVGQRAAYRIGGRLMFGEQK